jgi:tetratricopeptide (TPR) repeat protein
VPRRADPNARTARSRVLPLRPASSLLVLSSVLVLGGCSLFGSTTPPAVQADNGPTLKSLAGRVPKVGPAAPRSLSEEEAIAAYRLLLAAGPSPEQRAEALRRIGDLEMDGSDRRAAGVGDGATQAATVDYKAAIERYRDYLKLYPKDPANDKVLYQLARAHEQGGDLESALTTLNRLVEEFPNTTYRDEANFRRGELLFTGRRYADAETAYDTVLTGNAATPYRERSQYMAGWSQFKQSKLEKSLESFLQVLDGRLANQPDDIALDQLPNLSRADRELVEDSFRVASLTLDSLQGAGSIPAFVQSDARRTYEVRIYQQLVALYLKQRRPKDAADALNSFVKLHPIHAQAPVLQSQIIEIHTDAGFDSLALQAKKDFVNRYGSDSDYRKANPAAWEKIKPLLRSHLKELAQMYHALSQKDHRQADVQEAVHWYRSLLDTFPGDVEAARSRFLLAELLFEDKRYAEAAVEYELSAYSGPVEARNPEAGYAALIALTKQTEQTPEAARAPLLRERSASALRFAAQFGTDPRVPAVLTDAADTLYKLGDRDAAGSVAAQVLVLQPTAPADKRRVAWTIQGHTAFEAGNFALAEKSYAEVLALTDAKAPERKSLQDRLAASIYKQGELARSAGQSQDAALFFARVVEVAPESAVRVNAQYDAAAALILLKDWPAAIKQLEDFRQRFPKNPLQADVNAKLALAYSEQGNWLPASQEFERLSAAATDPVIARGALWQAAELREKGAPKTPAEKQASVQLWERYVKLYPTPIGPAIEARAKLAAIAQADGQSAKALALQKDILQADQSGGSERTDRTRMLGATAALAMAEPAFNAYKQVALVEPLQKQLKLKKAKLEEVLKAYALAADYGVAEIVTASTFQTGAVYQDFAKALMTSERPKRLDKDALEQYNLMLEETADPFIEKATALHAVNAKRASQGIYDAYVKRSFSALRELRPARYGKAERSEEVIDAIQ